MGCHKLPVVDGAGVVNDNVIRFDPERHQQGFLEDQSRHLFGMDAIQLLAESITTDLQTKRVAAMAESHREPPMLFFASQRQLLEVSGDGVRHIADDCFNTGDSEGVFCQSLNGVNLAVHLAGDSLALLCAKAICTGSQIREITVDRFEFGQGVAGGFLTGDNGESILGAGQQHTKVVIDRARPITQNCWCFVV
jgi:hypothetical protein